MSRAERSGCEYRAFVPDPLVGWSLSLPADVAADVADAELAVRALNAGDTQLGGLAGLARLLLRTESVASARIEGLVAGPRRILEAQALGHGEPVVDRVALEILANIEAMEVAVGHGAGAGALSIDDVREIHRILMRASPTPELAGEIRTRQNWIGGNDYNPCSATFVPPPPELVKPLLADLVGYLNDDLHPALVQAALVHAQFEAIHPFADGNGRTGRALIHVVLRRRGLAREVVPPVSLVLASRPRSYVAGLNAFAYLGPADSAERDAAAHGWLRTFAAAVSEACAQAERFARAAEVIHRRWRERVAPVRAGSSVDMLLRLLPAAPILTVESAARAIERSTVRAGEAVNRLVDAGVLRQRNVGRQRYRVFEAVEIIDLLAEFERDPTLEA